MNLLTQVANLKLGGITAALMALLKHSGPETCTRLLVGEGIQSTPGNQALTRDPSSCKVWSTGTELIEVAMTEMCPQAAESMFQVQNALAEPSEPQ